MYVGTKLRKDAFVSPKAHVYDDAEDFRKENGVVVKELRVKSHVYDDDRDADEETYK